MKPLNLVLLCTALAIAASAATVHLLNDDAPRAASSAEPVSRSAAEPDRALAGRLDALERRVAELAERPAATAPAPRAPLEDLDAAVRHVLAERAAELGVAEAGSSAPTPSNATAGQAELPRRTEELLALLGDPALGDMQAQLLWERVRAAGRIDEVLAAYEARAEARPDDPGAQVDLGVAYLQKLFQLGDGPVKGMVAMQADAAFDRALELDPMHWEARFTKAVSLSHWPPIFGKQGEAISHFETLVQQQGAVPAQPQHAQTYLLLGNLYLGAGKPEKALATYAEGAAAFPQHPELAAALAKLQNP